jgi:hypothetical protein
MSVQNLIFLTLDAEFESNSVQLNPRQGYMTLLSTTVQQIEHYGQTSEHKSAPGEGSGSLWRVASFARFEERDSGLYLELEVEHGSSGIASSVTQADY